MFPIEMLFSLSIASISLAFMSLVISPAENSMFGIQPQSVYFGGEINISNNNGTSELPQITAEGSNVYVVWQDNTTGNYDVFFKTSFDNGIKFKSTRNLSKNNGTSELPQIATHNNSMYVVWNDNSGDSSSIFFKNGRKDSSASNAEFGSLTKLRSF